MSILQIGRLGIGFRGTAAHNTPQIDGEEINRFVRPEYLWVLRNDAVPEVRQWSTSEDTDLLVGAHSGYQRLQSPVTPIRTIMLDKTTNCLFITDVFEGTAEHTVRIPYTFAPDIEIDPFSSGVWRISNQTTSFLAISSAPDTWSGTIESASFSPSYGVVEDVTSLVFERTGILSPIAFSIIPEKTRAPKTRQIGLPQLLLTDCLSPDSTPKILATSQALRYPSSRIEH